jgi:hypothetical protein
MDGGKAQRPQGLNLGPVPSLLRDGKENINQAGIELAAAVPFNFSPGFFNALAFPVRPVRGDGVESIGQRKNPGF